MKAKIAESRDVAKQTRYVVFDLLGHEVDFKPGQYFWVTLLDPPYDDEKGPKRHISVATSPNDRGVLALCTRLRDSAFKRSLAELPVGTEVEVEDPKGSFVLPEDTDRPYVFIAGGIGITVFRSMLRYIAEEKLRHRVTLVYSNRDRESTAFLDELPELERTCPSLKVVLTMTEDEGWDGETRKIDAEFLRDHLEGELEDYTYLVAGPARHGQRRRGHTERRWDPGGADPARPLQRVLGRLGGVPGEPLNQGRRTPLPTKGITCRFFGSSSSSFLCWSCLATLAGDASPGSRVRLASPRSD